MFCYPMYNLKALYNLKLCQGKYFFRIQRVPQNLSILFSPFQTLFFSPIDMFKPFKPLIESAYLLLKKQEYSFQILNNFWCRIIDLNFTDEPAYYGNVSSREHAWLKCFWRIVSDLCSEISVYAKNKALFG